MPKKYKLVCFHCGQKFKDKSGVFRNASGYPLCKDCFTDDISFDWDEEDLLVEWIESKFNRSYKKYLKYIKTDCNLCPKCNTYWSKDYFVDNMCQSCFENEIDQNTIKNILNTSIEQLQQQLRKLEEE